MRVNLPAAGFAIAAVAIVTAVSGCNGNRGVIPAQSLMTESRSAGSLRLRPHVEAVTNGGFESGGLTPWKSCGTAPAVVSDARAHTGAFSASIGVLPGHFSETDGVSAICQTVVVPYNATFRVYYFGDTNFWTGPTRFVTTRLSTSKGTIFASGFPLSYGWGDQAIFSNILNKYVGKTVTIYVGVHTKAERFIYHRDFIDDVTLATTTSFPSTSPEPTPTITPTATPTPVAPSSALKIYPLPAVNGIIKSIIVGPDKAFWFEENGAGKVGRMTTSGKLTEFKTPGVGNAYGIANGPDGAVWFAESKSGKIGRLTTTGELTQYAVRPPGGHGVPSRIVQGPDGAMWFIAGLPMNLLGRVAMDGSVTYRTFPKVVTGLAEGAGALWIGQGNYSVARMAADGSIKTFAFSKPLGSYFTLESDGAAWYSTYSSDPRGRALPKLGRIDSSGVQNVYRLPWNDAIFWGMTTGSDGALWASRGFAYDAIARIDLVTNEIKLYDVDASGYRNPSAITSGPDGAIWVVLQGESTAIGRLPVDASPSSCHDSCDHP